MALTKSGTGHVPAGWYIGSPVPLSEYPLFIAAGLASLFGGAILTIQFLLVLLKLPRDLFQFFVTIGVLGSRFSTLVVPKPTVFTPQGFGVARGNQSLAQTLDSWIIEEKAKGTVDALYRYWMLGDAARNAKPPRWSVIRDLLHWVP